MWNSYAIPRCWGLTLGQEEYSLVMGIFHTLGYHLWWVVITLLLFNHMWLIKLGLAGELFVNLLFKACTSSKVLCLLWVHLFIKNWCLWSSEDALIILKVLILLEAFQKASHLISSHPIPSHPILVWETQVRLILRILSTSSIPKP